MEMTKEEAMGVLKQENQDRVQRVAEKIRVILEEERCVLSPILKYEDERWFADIMIKTLE